MTPPEPMPSGAPQSENELSARKIAAELAKAEAEAAKAHAERQKVETELRESQKGFWRSRSFASSTLIPAATVLAAVVAFYSTIISSRTSALHEQNNELLRTIDKEKAEKEAADKQVASAAESVMQARLQAEQLENAALARADQAELRARQAETTDRQLRDSQEQLVRQISQSQTDLDALKGDLVRQKQELEEQVILSPAVMHLQALQSVFESYSDRPNITSLYSTVRPARQFLVDDIKSGKNQDKIVKYLLDNSTGEQTSMDAFTRYVWKVFVYRILFEGTSNPEWDRSARNALLDGARIFCSATFGKDAASSENRLHQWDVDLLLWLFDEGIEISDKVDLLRIVWESASHSQSINMSFVNDLDLHGRVEENMIYRIAMYSPAANQKFPAVYLAAVRYFQNRWLHASTPEDLNYYGGNLRVLSRQCWAITVLMNYSDENWQKAIAPDIGLGDWITRALSPQVIEILKVHDDRSKFIDGLRRWLNTADNRERVTIWFPFDPRFFIHEEQSWSLERLISNTWIGDT